MADVRTIVYVRNLSNTEVDIRNQQTPDKPGNHVVVAAGASCACGMETPWCDYQAQLEGETFIDHNGLHSNSPHHISVTPKGAEALQIFQHDRPVWYTRQVKFDNRVEIRGDAQSGKGHYELIIHADLIPEYKKI